MIDWLALGFSALWILGLSLELAAMSLAYYLAVQKKCRFWRMLEVPAFRMVIDLGMFFFCMGMAGSVSALWERLFFGGLAVFFAVHAWQTRKLREA